MNDIEQSLKRARTPISIMCPECHEDMYAPTEKLCIALYGKCTTHFKDYSIELTNLIEISKSI